MNPARFFPVVPRDCCLALLLLTTPCAQPVGVHALVGGTVHTQPGEALDGATIVIRDGCFEAVGTAAPE